MLALDKTSTLVMPKLKPIRQIFLNSPNPAIDPECYLNTIADLVDEFVKVEGKKKLIVNTCGWVEGLGAEIQLGILHHIKAVFGDLLQVVALKSASKTSDLVLSHEDFNNITIKGDLLASSGTSAHFSKGSVLRNYRLFDSLAPNAEKS